MNKVLRRKGMSRGTASLEREGDSLPTVPKNALAPAPEAEDDESEGMLMAKHHMATLMDADDIKADPQKMANVKKHAAKQIGKIKSIQDLKNLGAALGPKKGKNNGYVAS